MLNRVQLIGRLGRDVELRYTQAGLPIANMRIATDESYTDREGSRVEKTEWHSVVAFQRQAENCANYIGKGSLVYVEGKLETRKWQDQQGQDRYTTEIKASRVVFLNKKGDNQNDSNYSNQESHYSNQQGGYNNQQGNQQGGYNNQQGNQQGGYNNQQGNQQGGYNNQQGYDEDLGPAFPSEASGMDDVPF